MVEEEENNRNVMMVVVEVEENNISVVVVWLCYSRSCVEINIEYGVDVGSMWWREN